MYFVALCSVIRVSLSRVLKCHFPIETGDGIIKLRWNKSIPLFVPPQFLLLSSHSLINFFILNMVKNVGLTFSDKKSDNV